MRLTAFERGTYKGMDLRGNDLSTIRTRQTLAEPQPEFLSIVPFTSEVKEPRYRLKAMEAEVRNRSYLEGKISVAESVPAALREAAYDPQTSGGLLIALPAGDADSLRADLRACGLDSAIRIGVVTAHRDFWVELG